MHKLYIIHSESKNKFYVGETHDLVLRLEQHNNHLFNKGFTTIANDWVPVLDFKCSSKIEAQYLERFIKRMKSRKFILKIISDPTILKNIILRK